ncbi:hypothetical protein ACFX13_041318 [Malus domestica]|uniref:Uncharacterized protein n=1 Tax=Malus domestica TaxID=3750 RepID=A0A498JDF7_MALDO|nr:hypothetical protein DVH24_014126 [Malus domestica]
MNETLAAKDAALAVLAANPVAPEPDQESLVDPDPFAVTFRDLDSAPEVTYEAALGVMTKVEYVEVLAANVDVDADAKSHSVSVPFMALLALFVACSVDHATFIDATATTTATSRSLQTHSGFPFPVGHGFRDLDPDLDPKSALNPAPAVLAVGLDVVTEVEHMMVLAADSDATMVMTMTPCGFLVGHAKIKTLICLKANWFDGINSTKDS